MSKTEAGLAAGILNSGQQIGGAVGLAVFVSLAVNRTTSLLHQGGIGTATAQVEGSHLAFLAVAGLELVGVALAIAFVGVGSPRTVATRLSADAE